MKKYFFFFLFPAIAVLLGTIQAKTQDNFSCPDTIYICEGWNEISFPDLSVSSPLADFYITSSNVTVLIVSATNKTISGNKVVFYSSIYVLSPGNATLQYTYVINGNIICRGVVVIESDKLDFFDVCTYLSEDDIICNNNPQSQNSTYSFCEGDTTTIQITNELNRLAPPYQKMSPNRWNSSLGKIVSVNDYSFRVVWEKAGEECVYFTTSGSGGCLRNIYYSVYVKPRKKIDIHPSVPGIDTICTGQNITLVSSNIPKDKVLWKVSDDRAFHGSEIELSFDTPGSYEIIADLKSEDFVGQEEPCLCFEPDTFTIFVNEGDVFDILCSGPVCSGDTAIYYSSELCTSYLWKVSSGGNIVEGGTSKDVYVKIAWTTGDPGIVDLELPDCPGYCNKTAQAIIPVLSQNLAIAGKVEVCVDDKEIYSIQNIPGTLYKWSVISNGFIDSQDDYFPNQTSIEWLFNGSSPPFFRKGTVKVEYENCALGCQGESTLEVTIKHPFYILHDGLEKCIGSTADYSHFSQLQWTVTDPDGQNVVIVSDIITVNYQNEGLYIIRAEDINDYYCNDSYSFQVWVVAPPSRPTEIRGDFVVCYNREARYQVNPPAEGILVRWTMIDGTDTLIQTGGPDISYHWKSTTGPYQVSAAYIHVNTGCEGQATSTSVSNWFQLTGGNVACRLDTLTYSLTPVSSFPVKWSVVPQDAGTILQQNPTQVIVVWYRPGIHFVRAEICNAFDSIQTEVSDFPKPVFTYDSLVCKGSLATLQIALSAGERCVLSDQTQTLEITQSQSMIPAGKYQLTFTNQIGCTFVDSVFIHEYELKKPPISSPEFFTVYCNVILNPITIRTEAFTGQITYQWFKNNVAMPGAQNNSIITSDFGQYFVEITDENGCRNRSDIYELINDCGGGGGGGNPDDCPGCDPVGLNKLFISCAHLEIVVIPPFTSTEFIWKVYKKSLIHQSTGSYLDYTFAEVGDYLVTARGDNNEYGSSIINIPVISKFVYPESVCKGTEVYFSNTSAFLFDTSLYQMVWDFGDPMGSQNFSNDFHGIHVYNQPGKYTITLTITDPNGFCVSVFTAETEVLDVENIQIVSPDVHCTDHRSIPFEISPSQPDIEVSWDFSAADPGIYTAKGNPVAYTFPEAGPYTILAITKDKNGCISQTSKNVVVGKNLKTNDILCDVNMPKCPDVLATLTAPNNPFYLWNTGSTSRTITTAESGVYTVTVSDIFGCSEVLFFTIENNPIDHVVIQGKLFGDNGAYDLYKDSMSVCRNDLYSLFVPYNYNYRYKWSVTTSQQVEIYSGNLTSLPNGRHLITLEITELQTGCKVTTDPFILQIHGLPPVPDIVVLEGPLCHDQKNVLGILNPNPAYRYQWGDGVADTLRTIYVAGNYFVRTLDAFGCLSPSDYIDIRKSPVMPIWPNGCFEVCFPYELCVTSRNNEIYTLIRNETEATILTKPFSNIILTQPGNYVLEVRHSTDPGCSIRTKELDLSPKPLDHKVYGTVFWDRNENDVYDVITDSLLFGAEVTINIGNSVILQTTTDVTGNYRFDTLPSGFLNVLASAFVNGVKLTGGQERDLVFKTCIDSLEMMIPLRLRCEPKSEYQRFTFCFGDSLEIDGKTYTSTTRDTLRFLVGGWCDSTVVIEVFEMPDPDVSMKTKPTCFGETNGQVIITNQQNDVLGYSFDGGNTFSTQTLFEGLPVGIHTIMVRDTFGCVYERPFEIAEVPFREILLTADNTCKNESSGQITVVNADISTMVYRLSGFTDYSTQVQFGGLEAGLYTLEALDTFGCTYLQNIQIDVFDNPLPDLTTGIDCNTQEGVLFISGAPGCIYSIDNNTNYTSDTMWSGLTTGSHFLYVQHQNGCLDTMIFDINLIQVPEVDLIPTATCAGVAEGRVEIVPSDPGLSFRLDTMMNYTVVTEFTTLPFGWFTLYMKDVFGCEHEKTFFIDSFPSPVVQTTIVSACEGISEGQIEMLGNVEDYRFLQENQWSAVVEPLSLPSGTYSMVVRTKDGCMDTLFLEIPIIDKPQGNLMTHGSCTNDQNGSVIWMSEDIDVAFSLDKMLFTNDTVFTSLLAGDYILYVQSGGLCLYEYPFVIPLYELPNFDVEVDASCSGLANGQLLIQSEEGMMYEINGVLSDTRQITGLSQGMYSIVLTNTEGCKKDTLVEIPLHPELIVTFPEFSPDCNPKNLMIRPEIVSFGDSLRYMWNDLSTADRIFASESGNYSVTISDVCRVIERSWDIEIEGEDGINNEDFFPNIFAPRSTTEENRCFNPLKFISAEAYNYSLVVYDRWGEKIFETPDREDCWNGRFRDQDVVPGVYVYLIEYNLQHCGRIKKVQKYGDVTVMY